jgi:serine/threonine protein kinase
VREIEIHLELRHPHILQLYGAWEDSKGLFLMLEYCAGGDIFHDVRRNGGKFDELTCARAVIHPVLQALAHCHALGIVHRDLKPENILCHLDGTIRLCDFGLAVSTRQERPVTRLGTLDYMVREREKERRHPKKNVNKSEGKHQRRRRSPYSYLFRLLSFLSPLPPCRPPR